MRRLSYLQTLFLVICLGWALLGIAQVSTPQDLSYAPWQNEKSDGFLNLSGLINQENNGAWQDKTKSHVTYNDQGLCSTITIYQMQSGEWAQWKKLVYTYDNNNQLQHIETSTLYSGGWVLGFRIVFTYNGTNLVHIGHYNLGGSSPSCLDYQNLYYNVETGLLDYVIVTHELSVVPIAIRDKYVYEWDMSGRIIRVYRYRQDSNTWGLMHKKVYTYLPTDHSSYSRHYQYVVDEFVYNETRFFHGHHPFLFDVILNLSYDANDDEWDPYQKWEYIYDEEQRVTQNQYLEADIYGSGYGVYSQTRFDYEDNRIACETYYRQYDSGLQPLSRILYDYSGTGVEDEYNASPDISMLILYPNPFRQATTIEFELAKTGHSSLCVYNLKGQKVRDLCSNHLERGQHMIKWDGKDANGRIMAPGIYFIRLSTQGQSVVRKVMLL